MRIVMKSHHTKEISMQDYALIISFMIKKTYSKTSLTLLHSEWPKLHCVLAILSARGLALLLESKAKPTLLKQFKQMSNVDYVEKFVHYSVQS